MRKSFSSGDDIVWRGPKLTGLLLLSLVAVATTACTAKTSESESMNASAKIGDASAQHKPLRNLNPPPMKAYDIRVVLKDPPGPFAEAVAAAQYDVANATECGDPQPMSGAIPRISSSEPIELTKLSETEYTARVYVDRILDEDYYGRGTCRWELVEARVALTGSADSTATTYVTALTADAIIQQSFDKIFFSSIHYPGVDIEDYTNFGRKTLNGVADHMKGKFFEVEMSATEAIQ